MEYWWWWRIADRVPVMGESTCRMVNKSECVLVIGRIHVIRGQKSLN